MSTYLHPPTLPVYLYIIAADPGAGKGLVIMTTGERKKYKPILGAKLNILRFQISSILKR